MGANASKSSGKSSKNSTSIQQQKIEDLVDLGAVFPNGLYTTTTEQDYDARAVRNLIIARKIAPFYKGLEDAPETVTAAPLPSTPPPQTLSPPPLPKSSSSMSTISFESPPQQHQKRPGIVNRPRSASTSSRKDPSYDPFLERKRIYLERMKQREKMLYNDAVECPICFLYYPANINFSRCCDQPICTECFVQMHRPIETPSVPATCPFCMEENYGVLYETPSWSEKFQARSRAGSQSTVSGTRHTTSGASETGPRRKKVPHNSPDVVLVDHVRPNWKNLIPPSNNARTVSRRNSASAGSSSRSNNNVLRVAGVGSLLTRPGRSASSAAATEYNQYLTNMRDGNMDLEDWMVMEAIRLSLAEQEENERKEALKKCKQLEAENKSNVDQNSSSVSEPSSAPEHSSPSEPSSAPESSSVQGDLSY